MGHDGGIVTPFSRGQHILELGGNPQGPMFRPNFNVMQGPGVDRVCDLNEGIPAQDGEFDGVFGSYVIEHIRTAKIKGFIAELHRIIKPGAFAFMVTSNLYAMAQKLAAKDPATWDEDDICMVYAGKPDEPGNYHHTGFSPEYAVKLFQGAGFSEVQIFEHPNCQTDMIIQARK